MRILFLNQYFPPDTSATADVAFDFVHGLAQHHEVSVVAGRPSYAPVERHPYYWRRIARSGRVAVDRVGSTAYDRRHMAGRVANYLSFIALALMRAMATDTDFIVCMTDPPILAIACAVVARVRGVPWACMIQDLHPDMIIAVRRRPPASWLRAWDAVHRWALRKAACVCVLGEDMRARVIAKGLDPARVVIVRTGVAAATHETVRPEVVEAIRSGFAFVALHAGNLGFYGAWTTIVDAARRVAADGIGFVFIGEGALRREIESRAAGSPSIRFLPFRPKADLASVLASADVHVVTIRPGLEGTVVPSKLYGILAAGRPVLVVASTEADAARIVTRHQCGVVADPEDAGSVAAALKELASDPRRLAEMGRRAAQAAGLFTRESQVKRFVEALEAAALTESAPRS